MEKEIGSKEVKMDVTVNKEAVEGKPAAKPEKLSYEKLNEVAQQLSQQNQQMNEYIQKCHKQISDMAEVIRNKRLDYLLKVVELNTNKEVFDGNFVHNCVADIQQMLTPPTEENSEKKEE